MPSPNIFTPGCWKLLPLGAARVVVTVLVVASGLFQAGRNPVMAAASESAALASEAKEVLRAHCSECHSGDTAPAGVKVLDYKLLIDDALIEPGEVDNSRIHQVITSTGGDVMPPASRPPLSSEQITTIRDWIAAGAPAFPEDVPSPSDQVAPRGKNNRQSKPADENPANGDSGASDDRGVLELILAHVRRVPAEDRPFYRYFSTRHRLHSGATPELLQQRRVALAKAINHLSYESDLAVPTPLDKVAGGTVFAVDIRKLGWHRRRVRPVDPEPGDKDSTQQSLTLFDLVLLEYPYAIHREDDPTNLAIADEFLRIAGQVRPIPYLRVDWFCSVALQPPLYHDLMRLPRSLGELEDELDVDTEANLRDGRAIRAGITVSGVSRNNRIVERHPQSNGYYWKSHDFASNTGSENILVNPVDFQASGGEFIFRLPNGAQGYFVSNAAGGRIDAAPTSIVVDKHASDRVVRNGLGCIRCHAGGIKSFYDSVAKVLQVLPAHPGFDKAKARRLYPGNKTWQTSIKADRRRFEQAMTSLGANPNFREPLTAISSDYLERTLPVKLAAAELGLASDQSSVGFASHDSAARLSAVCSAPGFTRLGLAAFAAGGVIRRDSWEDNFDAAVRALGIGVPVVPINGLLRNEYLADPLAGKITLRTNKPNGRFEVGEKLRIFVDNNSSGEIHVDLFGSGSAGKIARLGESSVKIAAGETLQFPPEDEDPIEIKPGLGREMISLYASRSPLPSSTIYRGKNIDDRVVHDIYVLRTDGAATPRLEEDAVNIVKKSLFIETN